MKRPAAGNAIGPEPSIIRPQPDIVGTFLVGGTMALQTGLNGKEPTFRPIEGRMVGLGDRTKQYLGKHRHLADLR